MSEYSRLEESMRRREEQLALDALYAPVKPWTKAESSRAATDARRAAVRSSFAEFDRLYFPAEVHDDYAPPVPEFHGTIAADCFRRSMECTLILGPHNHAKSATVYKALIYCALTGAKHFVGIVSETLETPTEILRAVGTYLQTNDRIKHDYPDLRVPRFNAEELRVTTDDNPRGTVYKCFSEWKSPRGKNVNLFQRFDLIAIEDLENQMSAFDAQAVERRNAKLAEYQAALAGDGCLVWTANNLHPQCLANRKKIEYEQGTLDASWRVRVFQAWGRNGRKKAGPLWPARFPAKSEIELRAMLKPMDNSTWSGPYQQNPVPPEGFIFRSEHYEEYDQIPRDCIALLYCDPNLARKGKGDTTALGALLWSPSTQRKYLFGLRCLSFRDPNELLDAYLAVVAQLYKLSVPVSGIGFDGSVSQESHWFSHLRNYAALKGVPLPRVEFKSYRVDALAKNVQMDFNAGAYVFPEGFAATAEGSAFCSQLWAFAGKAGGKRDDAPDFLICVSEFLYERGYTQRPAGDRPYRSVRKRRIISNF